jgi:predicted amidophosphoribosyltransferase
VSRIRRTHYQSGLGSRERRRNLAGAFAVRGAIDSRHVLLIDDVITTGETCAQLARELLAHGTQKVSVLALARA